MKSIATPSRTKEILDRYQLHAKKKFGQNFIIEPMIIEKICSSANLDKETAVIEVGPGIGALTERLCAYSGLVMAYEIDPDMVHVLSHELENCDNLQIIPGDFLKADLDKMIAQLPYQKIKVVANLPYYITSKLTEKIALSHERIDEIIVMVQKDVAQKFAQSNDSRDRLPLTIYLNSIGSVKLLFDVPKHVFSPAPHVDSAILSVKFNHQKDSIHDKAFYEFLKIAFKARRKTLNNNLKSLEFQPNLNTLLNEMQLEPDERAEALSIEQLTYLFSHCTSSLL